MDHSQAPLLALLQAVTGLSRPEAVSLLVQVAALHSALTVHLLTLGPALPDNPNQLLTTKEASARLGISPRHLYRIANDLPFTRRDLGRVLFHAGGLSTYLASQQKDP